MMNELKRAVVARSVKESSTGGTSFCDRINDF